VENNCTNTDINDKFQELIWCVLCKLVVKRIFGPKREEDGSWRKLHNDELRNLYSSPNIVRVIKSRRMMWAGHAARMGEGRGVYRGLVGSPEGKTPLGRPRSRWEDNIKMYKWAGRAGFLVFDSRRGLGIFLFTTTSRTTLGPTQPPIQCVPGALSLVIKRPGREADHSPPSSAEVKE
jgi:hypothetical protein